MELLKSFFVALHEAWFKYCPVDQGRSLGGYLHVIAYKARILSPSWKSIGGVDYYLDTRDFVQRTLFRLGEFEPKVLSAIKEHLPPGGTFLDVGANIGLMSLPAAKHLKDGRVISVEPGPKQLAHLQGQIERNGLTNITVVPKGFGAENDWLELFISSRSNGGRNSLSSANAASSVAVKVEVVRGDEELRRLGIDKIDVIKLDIEGAEANALRGLEHTIRRDMPAIVIELIESSLVALGSSEQEVRAIIEGFGYRNSRQLDHANVIFLRS